MSAAPTELTAGDPITLRATVTGTGNLADASAPRLTDPLKAQMYLHGVVFTTGLADGGDHWIVLSGEADLACRVTHVPKSAFR